MVVVQWVVTAVLALMLVSYFCGWLAVKIAKKHGKCTKCGKVLIDHENTNFSIHPGKCCSCMGH